MTLIRALELAFMYIGIAVTAAFFTWITILIVKTAPKKEKQPERCPEWADERRWQATKLEDE